LLRRFPTWLVRVKTRMSPAETLFLKILLPDEQATKRLAEEVGRNVDRGALIALSGDLGAGKTVFAKALAPSLGIEELVTSPTFVLMNEYSSGRLPLYHLDLYRVRQSSAREASGSEQVYGSDQYLDTLEFLKGELRELMQRRNVVVIEWPEFLDDPLSDQSKNFLSTHDHVLIRLQHVNKNVSARIADIKGCGSASSELVRKLMQKFGDMIICS
jgi:tRNA threonylcarbamoyladenosine biosynthesis protein TsaE